MKRYDKLVRDMIPEIIKADGKVCLTRPLDEQELVPALRAKLAEELTEYLQSQEISELTDVVEVIEALVKTAGVTWSQFEQMRNEKRVERGGFSKGVLLLAVED